MHRQKTFFTAEDFPAQNWAWVLEYRYANLDHDGVRLDPAPFSEWRTFLRSSNPKDKKPSHFMNELRAHTVLQECQAQFERKIQMGLVEFRVEPKYIGYVPENEAWIE